MRSEFDSVCERKKLNPETMTPAEIFTEAARIAVDHWMIYDDEHRLRCACGVLLVVLIQHDREGEKLLVERELSALAALSAATTGVPVDFDRVLENPEDVKKFTGILRIWQEIKQGGSG